jgi:hypothetical protein
MPQLQNLILTDRAGTPVNHTFTPEGIDPKTGVASVVKTSGVPVGDMRYTISSRKSAARRRISIRLSIPVVQTQTINGISTPVVVRTSYANVDFNFDATSTMQERDDTVGMLASSLANTKVLVDSTVVDLEGIY